MSDNTFMGTDGADSYILGDATTDTSNVTIDAGAGDDLINLAMDADGNIAVPFANENFDVFGGDGDDVISSSAFGSLIEGGAGDDTINASDSAGSIVFGGDGNDTLSGSQSNSDGLTLDGGAGDDIIDGTGIENGRLLGGAGNDTITFNGVRDNGAGYAVGVDGGAGDDTIQYFGGAITDAFFAPLSMAGGEGSDTFSLSLNEGGDIMGDVSTAADGTAQFQSVNIGDFEQGEDVIVIDGTATDDGFTLATARLEAATDRFGDPVTQIVLQYESETESARDVIVGLGSANVDLSDITFVGDQTPASFVDQRPVS